MWFATTTSNEPSPNGSDCTSTACPVTRSKPFDRARATASSTMPGERSVSVTSSDLGSSGVSQKRPVPHPHSSTSARPFQSTSRASKVASGTGDVEYARCRCERTSSLAPVPYWTSRRYAWSPPLNADRSVIVRSPAADHPRVLRRRGILSPDQAERATGDTGGGPLSGLQAGAKRSSSAPADDACHEHQRQLRHPAHPLHVARRRRRAHARRGRPPRRRDLRLRVDHRRRLRRRRRGHRRVRHARRPR